VTEISVLFFTTRMKFFFYEDDKFYDSYYNPNFYDGNIYDGISDTATKTYDRNFDSTIGAPTGRIDGVSSATSRKDMTAE